MKDANGLSVECDSCDRSGDPVPPGIQNHAAEYKGVKCPGCSRDGVIRRNAWGMSPPHGWWVYRSECYCSSECVAKTRVQ